MTYSDVIILRLTRLCEERKITINKLATLSGITQSTVENIMSGKTKNPKLKTLHKLALGLGMTVSELLDFSEDVYKRQIMHHLIRQQLLLKFFESLMNRNTKSVKRHHSYYQG